MKMTSPMMVERVHCIPLIIERDSCSPVIIENRLDNCHINNNNNNNVDEINSGFPFDRDLDRSRGDENFRSQLDDIAKRHPEFAEHLEGFHHPRSGRTPSASTPNPEFRRFADRPFGSRFERFGFPFGREEFDADARDFPHHVSPQPQQTPPAYNQQKSPPTYSQQAPPNYNQQAPPTYNQQQAPSQTPPTYNQAQPSEQQQAPQQQKVDTDKPRKQSNIQQSNTVDLGQAQEAVNERNQRSMSAPPTENNRQGHKRFVSSINIPVNKEGMADMGNQQQHQQPQPQPQQQQQPAERVIPIHVEGRDEPVMPKNKNFTPQQQPQQQYQSHQQPQPERIFGHRPGHFTKFMGREPPQWSNADWGFPEEFPRHQQFQEQQKPHEQFQGQPQPSQQPPQQFQGQQAAPAEPKAADQGQQREPSQQHQQTNKSIDMIQAIQKDVSALMAQVEQFGGQPRDKQYLYLDEMLTRNLLKLDNIDTQGQENIRQARKEAIKCIEGCISILEAKAAANANSNTDCAGKPEEKMDVVKSSSAANVNSAEEQQKMEVERNQTPTTEKMDVEEALKSHDVIPHPIVAKSPSMFRMEQNQKGVQENMEVVVAAAPSEGNTNQDGNHSNVGGEIDQNQAVASKSEVMDVDKTKDVASQNEKTNENQVEASKDGDANIKTNLDQAEIKDGGADAANEKKEKKEKKKGKKKVEKK